MEKKLYGLKGYSKDTQIIPIETRWSHIYSYLSYQIKTDGEIKSEQ